MNFKYLHWFIIVILLGYSSILIAKNITTLSGETYKNIEIVKKNKYSIEIIHDNGLSKLMVNNLSDSVLKKYGYATKENIKKQKQKEIELGKAEIIKKRGELLKGADLLSWKLAKKYLKECEDNYKRDIAYSRSSTTYHTNALIRMGANSPVRKKVKRIVKRKPVYKLRAIPRYGYMQKTQTGDLLFLFPKTKSYYNSNQKKYFFSKWAFTVVKIVKMGKYNYGTTSIVSIKKCQKERWTAYSLYKKNKLNIFQ